MSFLAGPGTRIGDYVLVSEIGRGGMAVVYLAEHPNLGRKVALKVLSDKLWDDEAFRTRFTREARMAAGVEHPNIVPIYDAGDFEGLLFIAMRFIDGIDLDGLIRDEEYLSLPRALTILSQVAAALDAAHARGLVHRDVKPSNVLIAMGEGPGGTDHPYLADFGLARPLIGSDLTQAGEIYGTLDYMAPEQFEGKTLDGRSDIYALGCVAYSCLTGHPPFWREGSLSKAAAHLTKQPDPPSSRNNELPKHVDEAILRALAKEKADRYETAGAFVEALMAGEGNGDAALAHDWNSDVVRELRDEVARDLSREMPVAALMLALYRTGRQSEAIQLFQRHREFLAEKHGLDPSPVVIAVHDQLFRHELDSAVALEARDELPHPLTLSVGRESDIALCISLLEAGTRLLTLTGPGGVGKTRLAVELASAMRRGSSEAVFIDLGSVRRPDDVLPAIASAFTIPEDAARPLDDRLARHLERRPSLVVLDNFEHVIEAAADVSKVVARTLLPRFIITSRIRLHVDGEYVVPVAPLKVGTADERSVLRSPAVTLFVERARAADATFQLDAATAETVTELCRRLDGLPLAIELAAARVDVLSPSQILALLDEDANILTSRSRDVPDRHRSLAAALTVSTAALSDREWSGLCRLAVVPAVFDLDVADAVCGELTTDIIETVELLNDLVDESLVARMAESNDDQFNILQTVRAFAVAHASDEVDIPAARRRYVSSVASFTARAEEGLRGSQQESWLTRMQDRQSTIRAALSVALEESLWEQAALIVATTSRYWCMSGTVSEGRTWADRVLEHADDVDPGVSIPLINACGHLAEYQSDFDLAEQLHRRALDAAEQHDMVAQRIDALSGLAVLALWRGDSESSIALSAEAWTLASDASDAWWRQHVLGNLAGAHYLAGDVTRAKEQLQEALKINDAIGNLQGRSAMLANLSVIAIEERRYDDAASFAHDAYDVAKKLGDVNRLAAAASNAGLASAMLGRLDEAGASLAIAMELSIREHDHRVLSSILDATALLASRSGRDEDAATLYGAATALSQALKLAVPEGVEIEKEDDIRGLRQRLGDAFDLAWESGRIAKVETIVDLARAIQS
jgi:non-specific serine/threonine protein kinase